MIELTALEKTFEQPGGDRVPALRGVSLTIPSGEFLTVIGSNGSGKSTILNVIAGTYFADAGSVCIGAVDVTRWPEHRRAALVGRVFQDPFKGTCPSMTVAETLLMATLTRPDLLLLDEHTAALDPRAAEQVMFVTDHVVRTHRLTTLMVTHSMDQAVRFGDRTIMMHRGMVIADLSGEARRGVTEADLLVRFSELRYTAEMRVTADLAR